MTALPKTSLAMVQTAPRTLEAMDLPLPEIDDDSGLVRIEACGICGSDYEQFEGVLRTPMPAVPGHEPLGVVAKIGDRAAKRWGVDVGDRIAVGLRASINAATVDRKHRPVPIDARISRPMFRLSSVISGPKRSCWLAIRWAESSR
jgi:hypothetical protein